MSDAAIISFNGTDTATLSCAGSVPDVLPYLVAFLRRDGFDAVRTVFDYVPEFALFDPTHALTTEPPDGLFAILGYGWCFPALRHEPRWPGYFYNICSDGTVSVYRPGQNLVGSVNWSAPNVFHQVADLMTEDSIDPSSPWVYEVRDWDDDCPTVTPCSRYLAIVAGRINPDPFTLV